MAEEQELLVVEKNIGKKVKEAVTVIEVIATFQNNGFGIYASVRENGEEFTLCGSFANFLAEGQTYLVEGKVNRYKEQINIMGFKALPVQPKSEKGIISYLATLDGLKKRAELLYEHFGDEILELIVEDPERVASEVSGVGIKSVMKWREEIMEREDEQIVLVTLLGYGLTEKQIRELFNLYGESIIHEIKKNPYILSVKLKGYGFKKCDAIAAQMGNPLDAKERVAAASLYLLEQARYEGHSYLPYNELHSRIQELLEIKLEYEAMQEVHRNRTDDGYIYEQEGARFSIEKETFERAFNDIKMNIIPHFSLGLISKERLDEALMHLEDELAIKIEGEAIYETSIYYSELDVVRHILRLLRTDEVEPKGKMYVGEHLEETGFQLEEKQIEALEMFTSTKYGVQILCGGPGMGKTFTINQILEVIERLAEDKGVSKEIKIFAPTGRAAKVASISTGRDACTTYRGLQFIPMEGFLYNERNPLEADVVVIDEFSMMDVEISAHLLNAIPAECKVLIIGDQRQLSSVGPGKVLADLLEVPEIPRVQLNVVKRQGEGSTIVKNAMKIAEGQMIEIENNSTDAFFIRKHIPEEIHATLVAGVRKLMKKGVKMNDIQILVPMKNGIMGTNYINYLIQQQCNHLIEREGAILNKKFLVNNREYTLNFHLGDKVIQTENNYNLKTYHKKENGKMVELQELGVMNGEIGAVVSIGRLRLDSGEMVDAMWVKYGDIYVRYAKEFGELDHAFAISIHKSQGSQWQYVFLLISMHHRRMLENSVIYTGYTRPQLFCCLIGDPKAVEIAIKTETSSQRYSGVTHKLIENLEDSGLKTYA